MIGRLYALRDRMIGLSDKFGADVADKQMIPVGALWFGYWLVCLALC